MSDSYCNDYVISKAQNILENKQYMIDSTIFSFLNRSSRIFKYRNLPETITQRDLETYLQVNGYAVIAKCDEKLYAFRGGLGGLPSPYYHPTIAIVANPALKFNESLRIYNYEDDNLDAAQCVVIRNDEYCRGMMSLFSKYASLLIESEISLKRALINVRAQTIISADNDTAINSANKLLDKIEDGTSFRCIETKSGQLFDGIKTFEFTKDPQIKPIIESIQYIKGSFYNEIGLNSTFNMKREAINQAESNLNEDILKPFIDTMLQCRKIGVEQVNKLFGTNIEVEFDSVWEENKKVSDIEIQSMEAEKDSLENSNENTTEEKDENVVEEKDEKEGEVDESN